ncbi:hypothetical protein ymoll0001_35530 [Yersinia mollaretii ATCC 43969]|uniref:Uncharacterized protein n=1 Tax=Yersinia mollaretii (strain ATCC 43969 / DSM 18520 / CIP 103324 / CNY 7263 / WAIP 204) TaxID=349967 RepID=A0ABP2EFK2_YERMW|nr:hypothetical protein ymoll0001_35530 [Yersinia mollaretii ATCC 43969]
MIATQTAPLPRNKQKMGLRKGCRVYPVIAKWDHTLSFEQ